MSGPVPERLRFVDFELNLGTGELRRGLSQIPLQRQPFQVLEILVRRRGELVSREELRRALWAEDTFVDFDDGLNTAIRKIRHALADSADVPRFVETLPRRGYRFVAAVEGDSDSLPVPEQSITMAGTVPIPVAGFNGRRHRAKPFLIGTAATLIALVIGATYSVAYLRQWRTPRVSPIHSLAVLPLRDLSGNPSEEYFAEGMTDELITKLAKIGGLHVTSHTSVRRFNGSALPLSQIARELNVDALVAGSVTRAGGRVRVTAQLLSGPADQHLWADTFDSTIDDVLDLQERIAEAIAEHIAVVLTADGRAALKAARPVKAAAYDAYLRGRFFWNKYTYDGWRASGSYFEEASQLDPGYALAFVGFADSQMLYTTYGGIPPASAMPAAISALKKALTIDDTLGEAHFSMAYAKAFYEYDFAGAEREFQRALDLNPSYALGRQWHSVVLSAVGQFDEGVAEQRRALQLDPLSLIINTNLARALVFARRYDEALVQCRRTLELDPAFGLAHVWLREAYRQKNMTSAVFAEDLRAESSAADAARLKVAYESSGLQGVRQTRIEQLLATSRRKYVPAIEFALLYAEQGDASDTLQALERAYANREARVAMIVADPRYDRLRDRPAFIAFATKVGLGSAKRAP